MRPFTCIAQGILKLSLDLSLILILMIGRSLGRDQPLQGISTVLERSLIICHTMRRKLRFHRANNTILHDADTTSPPLVSVHSDGHAESGLGLAATPPLVDSCKEDHSSAQGRCQTWKRNARLTKGRDGGGEGGSGSVRARWPRGWLIC